MVQETSASPKTANDYTSVSGVVACDEVLIDALEASHAKPDSTEDKPQPQSSESSREDRSADTARENGKPNLDFSSPEIRYFKSYVGISEEEIERQEVSSIGDLGHSSYDEPTSVCPLELIWPIKLNVATWAESEANKSKAVPPVVSSGPYRLRINSPAIIMALQETITYWPGFDASLGSLEIVEPFMMLYHYRTELQEHTDQKVEALASKLPEQLCEREKNLKNHMAALFRFLDNRPEAYQIKQERQRHQEDEPSSTFNFMWLLFKPGTIVFERSDHDGVAPEAFVIHSVSGGVTGSGSENLKIKSWHIDSNGVGLGRQLRSVNLEHVDGKSLIGGHVSAPWEMYNIRRPGEVSQDAKEAHSQLVRRGELFVEAFGRKCVDFDGSTFSSPISKVAGRVIIDHDTFFREHGMYRDESVNVAATEFTYGLKDNMKLMPTCTCLACSSMITKPASQVKSPYACYDNIWNAKSRLEQMSERERENFYLLCTPRIFAYIPGLRVWKSLHISGAKEAQWNSSMIDDRLVMDPAKLKTIKALAYRYTQGNSGVREEADIDNKKSKDNGPVTKRPWAADFVEKKGDSVIFLLHGKLGVGKTYTAECVAEYVRRPLLSLTCHDIGTDPDVVEKKLAEFFRRAELWGAVILLDEADIFLEQRTLHDLARNSLVSAFLRSLEYFQGILFLTTNRVGTFDDAFLSRVHVVLHYEFEEAERKQVWKMFFNKLQREREETIRIQESARSYVEHNEDLKALAWNGRDIRNAFQTAVALAESEALSRGTRDGKVELTRDEFEQVVAMSKNFKHYLHKVHGQDQEKAAATRRDRHEHIRQQRP